MFNRSILTLFVSICFAIPLQAVKAPSTNQNSQLTAQARSKRKVRFLNKKTGNSMTLPVHLVFEEIIRKFKSKGHEVTFVD